MNNMFWLEYALNEHRERLREAEQWRLVQEALQGQERRQPMYRLVLAKLGTWLVAVGQTLENRYADICREETPCLSTVDGV